MSFFGNAQEFGSYCVLIAAIGVGMCRTRGGWKKGVPLYLAAAATCYTTLTRATFIQLFIATVAALTFTFGKKPTRMRWQPLIALAFALVIAFGGFAKTLSDRVGDRKSLADDSSLELRIAQWAIHASILQHSAISEQLLGLGFCQAEHPVMVALKEEWNLVLIDNLYVAFTVHIGIIGASLIVALLWGMWLFVRNEAIYRPTPILIGIASFWSTFLYVGMFNIQGAEYGFWFLAALILARRSSDPEPEPDWDRALAPAAA